MLAARAGSVKLAGAGCARYPPRSLKEAAQGSQMPWEMGPGASLMVAPHQAQMSFTLPPARAGGISPLGALPLAVAGSVIVPLRT